MNSEEQNKIFIETLVGFHQATKDLADNIKKLNDDFALHQMKTDEMGKGIDNVVHFQNETIKMYSKVIAAIGTLLLIAVGGAAVLEKFFNLK